jgi:hypothetical protein
MNENKHAIALMGNHEYNALAYAYQLPGDSFLRPHNEKNNKQHEATLKEFKGYHNEWASYLNWFYCALFVDFAKLRAVHACWDKEHIEWLQQRRYRTMNRELLVQSHDKNGQAYAVINDILKGKEFTIPEEYAWKDKAAIENREPWWVNPEGASCESFLFDCPRDLKDEMIKEQVDANIYPIDAPPIFLATTGWKTLTLSYRLIMLFALIIVLLK